MKDCPIVNTRPSMSANQLLTHLHAALDADVPFPLLVTGTSMVPFLRHKRDSVLLVSPEQRKPRRGEILLCKRPDGSLVLHRCLKIYKDGSYRLNGDSQQWCEHPSSDALLAVVDRITRKGKTISCDHLGYRLLAYIWMLCRPIRPIIFRIVALMRRLLGRSDASSKKQQ